MKRRGGFALVHLLLTTSLLLAIVGIVAGLLQTDRWGWHFAPLGILGCLFALKYLWDSRVALPRILQRLDRLNVEEGEAAPDIERLGGLWVSARSLERTLLPRLDLDGSCRRYYLELLAQRAIGRRTVQDRLRHLSEEPDPLAPRAREILSQHGLQDGPL
jgi:hypothetical protein